MLRRKSQLQGDAGKPQANWVTLERARLTQARMLALRRNDKADAAMYEAQLAELAIENPPVQSESTESASALLAKVNERNRKANLEAVRRAELQEAERKRRERRLGTPTAPVDPSARLRTVPRMFASRYEYRSIPSYGLHPPPEVRLRTFFFFLRSGPRLQTLAGRPRQTRRRPKHRSRPRSRVRPRLVLERAIFMRALSIPSRLIWATFECFPLFLSFLFYLLRLVLLPCCASCLVLCRVMSKRDGSAVPCVDDALSHLLILL